MLEYMNASMRRQSGENYLLNLFAPAQRAYLAVKTFIVALGAVAETNNIRSMSFRGADLHPMFLEYARQMNLPIEISRELSGGISHAVKYYLDNPAHKDSEGHIIIYPKLLWNQNRDLLPLSEERGRILRNAELLLPLLEKN